MLSPSLSPLLDSGCSGKELPSLKKSKGHTTIVGPGGWTSGTSGRCPREGVSMHSRPLSDSLSMGTAGTMRQRNGGAGARRLGVPSGLSKAILTPVYWAARTAPPCLCGDSGAPGYREDGEDSSGGSQISQGWEQKVQGGTLGSAGGGGGGTSGSISPACRATLLATSCLGRWPDHVNHTSKGGRCSLQAGQRCAK